MNTYRGIITTGLLLGTAGVAYAQSEKAADRREIEAGYARYAKAVKQKDMKAMFALMTKDGTFKEVDGKITSRPEMESMMKQMFATLTFTQITPQVTKWAWQDKAVLTDLTVKSAGKLKAPDGKTHLVTYVSKSRDHWVKQPGGWRIQQIEAVSEAGTVDGKPVMMPAPPPKK